MKKKNIKWLIIIGIALLAALALFFVKKHANKEVISLETGLVSRINISNSVTATGTVEPVTEVEVGTQVSGIIKKIYVDYNDEVKNGQVIAEMDKVTLQAEYESAQATLNSAKSKYEYAKKEYERSKALKEKDLISDAEWDETEYNYNSSLSAYKQAQSSITKVKMNLGYATITSPIDGVVISRAVEEGQTVAAGFSTPTLFTIAANLTEMEVVADVDEADIGQVKEGQRVEFNVDAYPDDTFEGTVKQVRLEATTTSNVVTYEVVIDAPNPDLKLKPGLTANVTIYTLDKQNVLSVPNKALRFNPDEAVLKDLGYSIERSEVSGKSVWVVDGSTLRQVEVETGSSNSERTEIEGLAEGAVVAVSMSSTTPKAEKEGSTERSPFAPGPRK